MTSLDTSTPTSLNAVDLHKEVLLDFGTADGMSGGFGVFVKIVDKIGGALQILDNICPHIPQGTHRGAKFAYLDGVRSHDIKVVPFHEELLAPVDKTVITPVSIERALELFASDANLGLVGPFVEGDPATKNT